MNRRQQRTDRRQQVTTSTAIQQQLTDARAQLDAARSRVADLESQLREAIAMESAQDRRREQMRAVMARLRAGQWASGIQGRIWWHDNSRVLIERATADELDALHTLAEQGVVQTAGAAA